MLNSTKVMKMKKNRYKSFKTIFIILIDKKSTNRIFFFKISESLDLGFYAK